MLTTKMHGGGRNLFGLCDVFAHDLRVQIQTHASPHLRHLSSRQNVRQVVTVAMMRRENPQCSSTRAGVPKVLQRVFSFPFGGKRTNGWTIKDRLSDDVGGS